MGTTPLRPQTLSGNEYVQRVVYEHGTLLGT